MESAVTYPLRTVLDALGIREATAINWSVRYQEIDIDGTRMKGVDIAKPGSGKGRERRVDAGTVVVLATIKMLTTLGLGPLQSAQWASVIRDTIAITKKHPSLTVRVYPDGEIIALPDAPFAAEPIKQGAEVELKIHVKRILARVHAALEQPVAKAA
jgi:hypothetical protein